MAGMRLGRRNILVAAYGSARFWRVPLRPEVLVGAIRAHVTGGAGNGPRRNQGALPKCRLRAGWVGFGCRRGVLERPDRDVGIDWGVA